MNGFPVSPGRCGRKEEAEQAAREEEKKALQAELERRYQVLVEQDEEGKRRRLRAADSMERTK